MLASCRIDLRLSNTPVKGREREREGERGRGRDIERVEIKIQ